MRTARVLLAVVGTGVIGFGVHGLLNASGPKAPLYMLAAVVASDLVLIPLAIASGWIGVRLVPPWARAATQAALLVTLALGVVTVPFIVKGGTFADNPSLLPLDYRRGLILAIGVTWLIAILGAVVTRYRHPPQRRKR